ncbi:PucR family transcriptional regulator [Amycolatopsis jejuensis]|uniref:PucR family transcriptional regulator n=1 Tax=Amycolatopsis jejuensis TaxID=330084 RepID=UPI0012E05400|nr:helix-turn-helix domain-containing protein [Amycolatopsis jejuensis]
MTQADDMLAMSRALTDGTGLAGVVTILRRVTSAPAAFVDLRGSLLASAPTRAQWPLPELRSWRPGVRHVGDPALAVEPVALDGDVVALLVVRPCAGQEAVFRVAAELASLELARLQALLTGRREMAGQILEDVFTGRSRGREARERLASLGIESGAPAGHSVLVGRTARSGAQLRTRPWNLHSLLAGRGDPYVRATVGNDLVLVVPGSDSLVTVARMLLQHLRMLDSAASVGIGPAASDPVSLSMSYHQARDAAAPDGVHHARPLNLGYLLLGSADTLPMREFVERALEPLTAHDTRTGSELLRSLVVYLDCDCSISQAADRLFVHRNTLRHRLNIISELTGWSPDTFDGRMHFWIATRPAARVGFESEGTIE